MSWKIVYTKQAQKDAEKLAAAGLKEKSLTVLELIREDPFHTSPAFEKLLGDLKGAISRRINIKHRIIYQVLESEKTVKVIRMWTHYE